MPINPYITNNFIDTCAFDPKYDPEDKAALKLLELNKSGKLSLELAHSTKKEIDHPNTPPWVKKQASLMIFTLNVSLTSGEIDFLRNIETIIAGNGKIENIKEDARHIFECQKYGSYFITTDKRLLKKRDELYKLSRSIHILLPSKFLDLLNKYERE